MYCPPSQRRKAPTERKSPLQIIREANPGISDEDAMRISRAVHSRQRGARR